MHTSTMLLSKLLFGLLLIFSYLCIGTLSDMGKLSSPQNHFSSSQSQFTTRNNTRVIAQKGGLAVLPCVVKVNSPATVSWIRRKDFQLLTVGLSTHSSDKRFLVEHTRHMGHWSLRIKSVREDDRGFYECQLSIYPTQSIFVELKVVEAVAEITGSPDLHIDEGSALRLECKLKRATENPAFVFWYHDNKMVNYDSQNGFSVTSISSSLPTATAAGINGGGAGGGVSRIGYNLIAARESSTSATGDSSATGGGAGSSKSTAQKTNSSSSGSGNNSNNNNSNNSSSNPSSYTNSKLSSLAASASALMAAAEPPAALTLQQQHQQSAYLLAPSTSILTIQEVHFHHGGNYTCAPSNARPNSITVHVLRGERPAAMQHANRSSLDGEHNNNSSSTGGSLGGSSSAAPNNGRTWRHGGVGVYYVGALCGAVLLAAVVLADDIVVDR